MLAHEVKFERMHPSPGGTGRVGDIRSPAQHDRDRIIYTAALRRLEGVTQVVGPLEGHVFHNRLTHTLEVAQIARRLAERFKRVHDEIDPDVVEAAALAHDLGHPPFGHIAEHELDHLACRAGDPDGFEGNAQSFRIVTRLSEHQANYTGLNLTRATLNAVLKYPWFRGDNPHKPNKFGAYRTERQEFEFARAGSRGQEPSIEAAIMDYADAVAYSVHDMDDFYRAGLIPLEHVLHDLDYYVRALRSSGKVAPGAVDRQLPALKRLIVSLPAERRYRGTREERVALRSATSWLINDFVSGVSLRETAGTYQIEVPEDLEVRMRFLQSLVWHHVIDSPSLATQQHGQRNIIRKLFRTYLLAVRRSVASGVTEPVIPASFRSVVENVPMGQAETRRIREVRVAVDIVASLSDAQAVALYRRMTGFAPGSVTDIVDG